jgi:hypothetical protein
MGKNPRIAKVPDGITRDNVEFVERRKTDSKYKVSTLEKIAAVFNEKFAAFSLEMETINPDCPVKRLRAIWAMRSHFINEIELPDEDIDADDILLDEDDVDALNDEFDEDDEDDDEEDEEPVKPPVRRIKTVYKTSRRLIMKDIDKIIASLYDLKVKMNAKP